MTKKYRCWLATINVVVVFISGCQNQVNTQCSQIIEIANNTNQQLNKILQTEKVISHDFKIWLQAVDVFDKAIAELKSLQIKDEQLVDYQDRLAHLWQAYANSTQEAIKAREIKGLSILTKANNQVQTTDQQMQRITEQINSYCHK